MHWWKSVSLKSSGKENSGGFYWNVKAGGRTKWELGSRRKNFQLAGQRFGLLLAPPSWQVVDLVTASETVNLPYEKFCSGWHGWVEPRGTITYVWLGLGLVPSTTFDFLVICFFPNNRIHWKDCVSSGLSLGPHCTQRGSITTLPSAPLCVGGGGGGADSIWPPGSVRRKTSLESFFWCCVYVRIKKKRGGKLEGIFGKWNGEARTRETRGALIQFAQSLSARSRCGGEERSGFGPAMITSLKWEAAARHTT